MKKIEGHPIPEITGLEYIKKAPSIVGGFERYLSHNNYEIKILEEGGWENSAFFFAMTFPEKIEGNAIDITVRRKHLESCSILDHHDSNYPYNYGKSYLRFRLSHYKTVHTIGYYFIESNILLCSDLTHNREGLGILKDIAPYIEMFRKMYGVEYKNIGTVKQITLGTDPEFELVDGGYIVSAEDIPSNRVIGSTQDPIGVDGAGDQLELRPKPASSPEELVNNLRALLQKVYFQTGYNLDTASSRYPCGCHIHIGVEGSCTPDDELLDLYDRYVATFFSSLHGCRDGYAQLSAYREQPHGFEYRTLPAPAVHEPVIAYVVFKAIKNITEKYIGCGVFEVEDSDIPTIEELVREVGLTQEEAKYLTNYKNKYHSLPDVLACWVDKRDGEELCQVNVLYSDDTFSEEFRDIVGEVFADALFSRPRAIRLYGLDKCRGVCTRGFKVGNFPEIPGKAYGLPYYIRVRRIDNYDVWRTYVEIFLKAILREEGII